jgi:hypothetical protein
MLDDPLRFAVICNKETTQQHVVHIFTSHITHHTYHQISVMKTEYTQA